MSRFIEMQNTGSPPSEIALRVGDILWLAVSGAAVTEDEGKGAVQMFGPLQQAVLGTNNEVLTPQGPPNTVLLVARSAGSTTLTINTGDPWRSSTPATLRVLVEP